MKKLIFLLSFLSTFAFADSIKTVVTVPDSVNPIVKVDSISLPIVTGDTVLVTDAAGTFKTSLSDLQKPTGRNFWDWAVYVISFFSVLFLIFISSYKKLHEMDFVINSKSELLKRFFSETTGFLKDTQLICASIAGVGTLLLSIQGGLNIIPPSVLAFIQTVTIASLAIAGALTISTRKK